MLENAIRIYYINIRTWFLILMIMGARHHQQLVISPVLHKHFVNAEFWTLNVNFEVLTLIAMEIILEVCKQYLTKCQNPEDGMKYDVQRSRDGALEACITLCHSQ